jgi:uncharacterized membrane protein YjgN (DUF898 family)
VVRVGRARLVGMSQHPSPSPFNAAPRDHPQTTTVLVLGILALVLCQVLGPFAWVMGNKALREIDASQGQLGGRETVNVGRILGMVATGLMVVALIGVLVLILLSLAFSSTSP